MRQTGELSSAIVDAIPPEWLNAASPSLTTPETRAGLTYTLREGSTLQYLQPGDTKLGDGQPWTPKITVKGGPSGFYTIKVTK